MIPKFIHLNIHSDYSIKDGLIKINTLLHNAKRLKMPAIALTDHMNLFGLIKFYNLAYQNGIKPIIGIDMTIKFQKTTNEFAKMTALATNNVGYQNLITLLSLSYKNGYNIIGPYIDMEYLKKYNTGIILLSGGIHGDIGKFLIKKDTSKINNRIDIYKKYFPNRYYIELTRTDRTYEENYIHSVMQIAITNKIPVVATNDVRFLKKEDFYAHEIRVAIQNGKKINEKNQQKLYSTQQYMRSTEEMCKLFSDIPSALINSVKIAEKCNVTIKLHQNAFPKFPTGNISNKKYLIQIANKGLKKRLKNIYKDENIRKKNQSIYAKRLKNELDIVNCMNLSSYFLIVTEFIQWAKKNNIPVGPGRGSGAGSLVAYALGITELNPIKFNLLFERFLNPERTYMPDLDIDFCMKKRDLVIKHVMHTYGKNTVSHIITFGTMTAKAVIRDVGRTLGYPYNFVDQIAKLIPFDPGITLKKSLKINPILDKKYQNDPEIQRIINISIKLEGIIKNVGKHAGGIVIAPTDITNFMPLYCDSEGNNTVTQFDKYDIEYLGLVKFDFLGLRTLTIIDKTLKLINQQKKQQNIIKINEISLKDKKTFKTLKKAETTAIFQLESHGIKNIIKKLKPDCFEDIIALIALFRPGPLQSGMVKNFINRKNKKENIIYLHNTLNKYNSLKSILKTTYGIILYQEQVMQIAQILAGYTLKNADILRYAMAKKNPEEMKKQRIIFNQGTKKMGINHELSTKIFNLIEKFSGYGFNKSHSAAYALLSYQTLWLKTHYSAEFMAATMNADIDNIDKIVIWIHECLRLGIKILPPNINNSQYYFVVNEKKEIIYGMGAIKGIGKKTIQTILEERNKNGKFLELFDLFSRTNFNIMNKKILEKFIMSGTLDNFGIHRSALMYSIENLIYTINQHKKNKIIGQLDIFDTTKSIISKLIKKNNKNIFPWTQQIILENERKSLGIYFSGHPIEQFLQEIQNYQIQITPIKHILLSTINYQENCNIVGIITSIKIITTKHKNNLGFIIIYDNSEKIEIIISNEIIEKYPHLLKKHVILFVQGKMKINKFNKKFQIIAKKIMDITQIREKYAKKLTILLNKKQINYTFINNIKKILKKFQPGTIPVYIYYDIKDTTKIFQTNQNIKITPHNTLINQLCMLIGKDKIKLEK